MVCSKITQLVVIRPDGYGGTKLSTLSKAMLDEVGWFPVD